MTFVCGLHRAYVYARGGTDFIGELTPLTAVRWSRVRDDVSVAEVIVPTSECCDLLADLRTIKMELHIVRNGEPVWEGPITRIEYEWNTVRVFAEDILWATKRCVIEQGYSHAYPNIGYVIERMNALMYHCYQRADDAWNVIRGGHIRPLFGPSDARTSRTVFSWQMNVWEDFDKYAEDYGADYTVVNRDIYFWDIHLKWFVIPSLDEGHLSQYPRIVEYGNQLATRGIVTNARGFAGVSTPDPDAVEEYGVVDWLTTNEIDGQSTGDPTSEEVEQWRQTALHTIAERMPSPVSIVVPANTTLLPGAPWGMHHLVPGAWFEVTTTRMCRQVTEWQRLQEIVVTEEAPNGEQVQFTSVTAPTGAVVPLAPVPPPIPIPPGLYVPAGPRPELPSTWTRSAATLTAAAVSGSWLVAASTCTDVLTEPFNNFTDNGWTVTSTPAIVAGRTGTAAECNSISDMLVYNIPAGNVSPYVTIGMAHRTSNLAAQQDVFAFMTTGAVQNRLVVNTNGSLSVARSFEFITGGSSAVGLIAINTWNYIELQIYSHDSAGTVTVRVNGTPVITVTGQDTRESADTNQVRFRTEASTIIRWDDLYLSTGAGCAFQGDPNPTLPVTTGLQLHLDAADASMFTYSAGTAVSAWNDKSGNARHFVQADVGQQPNRNATIGAWSAVRFSSALPNGDLLTNAGFASAFTSAELFIVIQNVTETNGGGMLIRWGTATTSQHYPFTDGVIYEPWGTTVRKTVGNPTPALTSPRIYNLRTASGSYVAELDGGALFSTATNTVGFAAGPYYLGWGHAAGTYPIDAVIGEVIVYNAVLSDGDRTSVETYLGAKWGITIQGDPVAAAPLTWTRSAATLVVAATSGSWLTATSAATMFGVGIYHSSKGTDYDEEWALHVSLAGAYPTITRAFGTTGTFTWTWPNVPSMRQSITEPGVTNVWVSLKPSVAQLTAIAAGTYNTQWSNILNGIPDDYVTMLTLWHEPENDAADGTIVYQTWLEANIQLGNIVQSKGRPELRFGPVFMGDYYITGVSSSNLGHLPSLITDAVGWGLMDDWQASVDFIGWDPYHEGSVGGDIGSPRNLPGYYFDGPYDFTTTNFPGKPMAIGETGFVYRTASPSAKPTWLDLAAEWAIDHDLMACCYFDALIPTEPPWYLSFQGDTATHDTVSSTLWGSYYT